MNWRDRLDRPLSTAPTVDPGEVARFAGIAEEWWDPDGRFQTLHQLNPVRLAFIRDRVARLTGRDPAADLPFAGLRVLDIGCGGGLLSEPAAFLGARVVGIDATAKLVEVARTHAALVGINIDYRHTLAEDLASAGEKFDVILNTEVIEHVANVERFVACCCRMLRPGGIMIVATLNRTLKSFLYAKVAGEYILGLLPRGTHDWRRFIKPEELAENLSRSGVVVQEFAGVAFNPLLISPTTLSVAPSSSAPASDVTRPPSNPTTTRRPSTLPKSNISGLHSVGIGDLHLTGSSRSH